MDGGGRRWTRSGARARYLSRLVRQRCTSSARVVAPRGRTPHRTPQSLQPARGGGTIHTPGPRVTTATPLAAHRPRGAKQFAESDVAGTQPHGENVMPERDIGPIFRRTPDRQSNRAANKKAPRRPRRRASFETKWRRGESNARMIFRKVFQVNILRIPMPECLHNVCS